MGNTIDNSSRQIATDAQHKSDAANEKTQGALAAMPGQVMGGAGSLGKAGESPAPKKDAPTDAPQESAPPPAPSPAAAGTGGVTP
jgi:hypothetical protein